MYSIKFILALRESGVHRPLKPQREEKILFSLWFSSTYVLKNRPAQTNYYGNLFGNSIKIEYESKAKEVFKEKVSCSFLVDFNAIDISIIDKMPEIIELYDESPRAVFYFDRNFLNDDNEKIEEMIEYLSSNKYNINLAHFVYSDTSIDRILQNE